MPPKEKTHTSEVPVDLQWSTLWHPVAKVLHAFTSSAASPVPTTDERHISANSYDLTEWQQLWDTETSRPMNFSNPNLLPPICNLGCKSWTRFNRLLIQMIKVAFIMQKFGWAQSPQSDCRTAMQMVEHVAEKCTIRRLKIGLQPLLPAKMQQLDCRTI